MPQVAAKKQVAPPTKVTHCKAAGAYSNRGEQRAIMKTPAVTIVAACISAETGVGPSMASGNHVCKPNCADFPQLPINKRMQIRKRASTWKLQKITGVSDRCAAKAKIAEKLTVLKSEKRPMIPRARAKSPTRFITIALIEALDA